jgi:hypothetical protein
MNLLLKSTDLRLFPRWHRIVSQCVVGLRLAVTEHHRFLIFMGYFCPPRCRITYLASLCLVLSCPVSSCVPLPCLTHPVLSRFALPCQALPGLLHYSLLTTHPTLPCALDLMSQVRGRTPIGGTMRTTQRTLRTGWTGRGTMRRRTTKETPQVLIEAWIVCWMRGVNCYVMCRVT